MKPKTTPYEGFEFGPWLRSKAASYRHSTDRRSLIEVRRTDAGAWVSALHGVREWRTRHGAERAADKALKARGAVFTSHTVMDEYLSFRVSGEMLARFKRAACGIELSDWVRDVLCAAVGDSDAGTPAEVVE